MIWAMCDKQPQTDIRLLFKDHKPKILETTDLEEANSTSTVAGIVIVGKFLTSLLKTCYIEILNTYK